MLGFQQNVVNLAVEGNMWQNKNATIPKEETGNNNDNDNNNSNNKNK